VAWLIDEFACTAAVSERAYTKHAMSVGDLHGYY